MTLAQAKFSNEMYQKVDDLLRNQSGIVEELTANLGYPLAKLAILDDFEQLHYLDRWAVNNKSMKFP